MDNIIFSIVVPVYNVELYLKQCLDSVIYQTYKNYELILVNDGSTDSSYDILLDYSYKHPEIIIINKENGGLSSARNVGIKSATGDYIIFLDSDDYWDNPNALCLLSDIIKERNADIINWGFSKYFENTGIFKKSSISFDRSLLFSKSKTETIRILIKNKLFIASAWNKAIKKKLLIENNLFFVEGIYSEDVEWCARLLYYSHSFDVLNDSFYVYRQRKGSISKSLSNKNLLDLTNSISNSYELSKLINDYEMKKAYLSYVASQISNLVIVLHYADKSTYKYIAVRIKKYRYTLKFNMTSRGKIINILISTLGLFITTRVFKLFFKLDRKRL